MGFNDNTINKMKKRTIIIDLKIAITLDTAGVEIIPQTGSFMAFWV